MQRIIPNIWFNGNAEAAGAFYTDALPSTTFRVASTYPQTGLPEFQQGLAGAPLVVEIDIEGFRLALINAGPEFRPNPSVSFMLNFDPSRDPDAAANLDAVWAKLSEGGTELMPLAEYPFSPRYGWIEDRYGVSWQLILTNPDGDPRPFVIPALSFGGVAQNRARAAITSYLATIPDSRLGMLVEFGTQTGPAAPDAVMFSDMQLGGQWFVLNDAGAEQDFSFSPGVSLQVNCADQNELDAIWSALSAVPEAEQCGWCADEFGVNWQVVPEMMDDLLITPAAYQAMLDMKKIDIAALEELTHE